MIIDVHGHLVPPDLLVTIRKESGRFPSLRLVEDGAGLAIAFAGGKPSRLDHEGAERRHRPPRLDEPREHRPPGQRRLAGLVRLRAASGRRRGMVPAVQRCSARRRQGRAALRAARKRAAAGRRARCHGAQGGDGGRLPGRHDLDPAARHRQRARRRRPRPVLGGGGRDRCRHPHSPELRRRRFARERLRPRQRRRPYQRRHRRDGAAPLQRPRHALPQRPHLRAHGRRRPAVPARPPHPQRQDHARGRRPGRRARPHLHRHYPARPAGAAICRGDDRRRSCDDGLRRAVPDRRRSAREDHRGRRACRPIRWRRSPAAWPASCSGSDDRRWTSLRVSAAC